MTITISEAATLLGKSKRQIRYMIQQGKLKAEKAGKEWLINREHLPLSEAQLKSLERKAQQVRSVIDDAIGKPADGIVRDAREARKKYALATQSCFKLTKQAYGLAKQLFGGEHQNTQKLHTVIELVTKGWFSFIPAARLRFLRYARELICEVLTDTLLIENPSNEHTAFAELLEFDIIVSLSGLIRSSEKRNKRQR